MAVIESIDDPPDLFSGIVLDVGHVGLDHILTEMANHVLQLADAAGRLAAIWARRSDRFWSMFAYRVWSALEQATQVVFAQLPVAYCQYIGQKYTFLIDMSAIRWH